MIPNLFLVAFVALSSHSNLVQTSGDRDLNRNVDSDDLTHSEKDKNIQRNENGSISTSSGSKRKNEDGSNSKAKRNQLFLKYRKLTVPVTVNIDDKEVSYLIENELEMFKAGTSYKYEWQDHNTLSKEQIRCLCIKAWLSLKTNFIVKITDKMEPDCDGALILGPSNPSSSSRKMRGHFQYAPDLKNVTFQGDILRCNCAYTELLETNKTLKTVKFSKQFFYMLKVSNEMYCILTIIGELESRNVKVIGFYHP